MGAKYSFEKFSQDMAELNTFFIDQYANGDVYNVDARLERVKQYIDNNCKSCNNVILYEIYNMNQLYKSLKKHLIICCCKYNNIEFVKMLNLDCSLDDAYDNNMTVRDKFFIESCKLNAFGITNVAINTCANKIKLIELALTYFADNEYFNVMVFDIISSCNSISQDEINNMFSKLFEKKDFLYPHFPNIKTLNWIVSKYNISKETVNNLFIHASAQPSFNGLKWLNEHKFLKL